MSKNYELIATVDIDLANPIVDESSYGNLLIVGPKPKAAGDKTTPAVGEYSSLDEVVAAGFVTSGAGADPVGVAAQVAFGQSPRPGSVFIATIQMTKNEDGQDVAESALATVQRAVTHDGWYVICPAGIDPSEYAAIAEYIEKQEKVFCYTELDCFKTDEDTGEVRCAPAVTGELYRTMFVYGRETSNQADDEIPEYNKYINVAMAAKWLQYDAGSETAAFKVLNLVNPSKLTSTEVAVLTKANGNYFTTVGSSNITMNGTVLAGEWADIIRFRDWQKNDMQVAVANLFITVPKVPYTDAGIALVQNQMVASLKRGQDRGGIAEEEYDDNGNTIAAYATSVPKASAISATDKASRKLRNLKFSARLAGAVHFAELTGSLTYEL